MNYVKSLNLLGIEAKEIPSITGEGIPSPSLVAAVGCLYMDINTGLLYKCTAITDNLSVWKSVCDYTDEAYGDFETIENKVTVIDAAADHTKYPTAKAVYDLIGSIDSVLDEVLAMQDAMLGGVS
jgi:hypothetical protein